MRYSYITSELLSDHSKDFNKVLNRLGALSIHDKLYLLNNMENQKQLNNSNLK